MKTDTPADDTSEKKLDELSQLGEQVVSSDETDDFDDDESSKPLQEDEKLALSFDDIELDSDLRKLIDSIGWKAPTPVQAKCLVHTTVGRDVAGFAQTGTGKTGVFLITLANTIRRAKQKGHDKSPKALILVPTRELAVQIQSDAEPIFDGLGISSLAVYGGVDYDKQSQALRQGVDVIVATPGRLKDFYQKKVFSLEYCSQFVCDEADRMFDMGFVEDIEYFLSKLTEKTQKLLFSATTNDQVKELAFEYLENPEYISVNPEVMTPERIEQHAIICESTQKLQVMLGMLRDHAPKCSIIFTNTKLVAEWLHYKLEGNGIVVDLITGDLPQKKRISLINRIKAGEIKALIATDVASRGLHISDISHVYNFDLPNEASNYVHRIGRTARAGAKGFSYSLVCEDYGQNLQAIKDYIGDQVSIDTEWFPESYLEIEDKAGNPYTDASFKNNRLPREADKRDFSKDKFKRKDNRRQKTSEREDTTRRPRRQNRTERGQRDPSKLRKSSRNSSLAQSQIEPVSKPTSNSLTGIFKRIFALIFGRKG